MSPTLTVTTHYFTFGQAHVANIALPNGGKLCDYWVAVESTENHREIFIARFTTPLCPRPQQFSMEYEDVMFSADYFPGGELVRITQTA